MGGEGFQGVNDWAIRIPERFRPLQRSSGQESDHECYLQEIGGKGLQLHLKVEGALQQKATTIHHLTGEESRLGHGTGGGRC